MTTEPRFREGDVVDIVFRRAIVDEVHKSGRLMIVHTEEEFHGFSPHVADVEVTVVGNVRPGEPGYIDGLRMPLSSPGDAS